MADQCSILIRPADFVREIRPPCALNNIVVTIDRAFAFAVLRSWLVDKYVKAREGIMSIEAAGGCGVTAYAAAQQLVLSLNERDQLDRREVQLFNSPAEGLQEPIEIGLS